MSSGPETCLCLVARSCLTLCDPMDYSLPVSSDHGILQTRILEQVAISSSRGSSRSRDWTHVSYISCIGRQILYHQWQQGSPEHVMDTWIEGVLFCFWMKCPVDRFEVWSNVFFKGTICLLTWMISPLKCVGCSVPLIYCHVNFSLDAC